jgi:MFS family permease
MTKPSKFSLFALSWLVFLISDTQGGVGPFIAIYLKTALSWDAGRIGMVLAMYNIASLCCQIPSGFLIDYVTFKRFLIGVSSCMVGIGCLLIVNSKTLAPILFAQTIIGIATSIIPPAIAAVTLGLVGRKAFPERLALNGTFNHSGNVTNTLLTGLMVYFWSVTWILYVDFTFSIISIIPLLLINKNEINNNEAREAPGVGLPTEYMPLPIETIITNPVVIFYGISLLLFTFANSAQLPLVGQKIANVVPNRAATYMASSIVVAQLVMIGVTYLLSLIIDKIGRKVLFVCVYAVLFLRAGLYLLTANPNLLLAIQVLDGLASGIFSIVSVVVISDLAKNTGRFNFMQGMMIFCISIGSAFSNLVSGYVAKLFGLDVGIALLGVVAFIGLIFYITIMPETKGREFLS